MIAHLDQSRGSRVTMIDRHYGHLARGGRVHAIKLLGSFTGVDKPSVHAVDAAWMSQPPIVAAPESGNRP